MEKTKLIITIEYNKNTNEYVPTLNVENKFIELGNFSDRWDAVLFVNSIELEQDLTDRIF